jgi:hypothetical protein
MSALNEHILLLAAQTMETREVTRFTSTEGKEDIGLFLD